MYWSSFTVEFNLLTTETTKLQVYVLRRSFQTNWVIEIPNQAVIKYEITFTTVIFTTSLFITGLLLTD